MTLFCSGKDLKVLYVSGLESGPKGRKVIHLKHEFDVYAADMRMGVYEITRKNSFLRKALKQHLLPLLVVMVMLIFAIVGNGYYIYILYGITALYVLLIVIFHKRILGYIVLSSFDSCLEIQKNAILEYKPDLIVSSSWGGAIAFELIKQNIWNGPAILICPAYLRVKCVCNAQKMDYNLGKPQEFIAEMLNVKTEYESHNNKTQKWLIFHGEEDNIVNIKDSELIVKCNQDKFELNRVENNGHGMKDFVVSQKLNDAIKQYMNIDM